MFVGSAPFKTPMILDHPAWGMDFDPVLFRIILFDSCEDVLTSDPECRKIGFLN
jgi:hypothetical protein